MKGKSNKIISIIFILILVMLVSMITFANEKPIELTIAGVAPITVTNPSYIASEVLASEIERLTDGRIIVNNIQASQLGGERDILEGVQIGTIDIFIGGIMTASTVIREYDLFNLPFLFVSKEHVLDFVHSPTIKRLKDIAENYSFKCLMLSGPSFRYPMNSVKPITKPDDFKGMKYRTMEVQMHLSTYRSFGANAVPVAWTELYTALMLGTVVGTEQAPVWARNMSFHEVQDYLTTLPVLLNGNTFLMDLDKFNSFSEEDQAVILRAAEIATEFYEDTMIKQDKIALEEMEQEGLEVYRISTEELQPFIEASKVVYDEFLPTFSQEVQDIVSEIRKIGEKY